MNHDHPEIKIRFALFVSDDYKQSEAEKITFQFCMFKKLKENGEIIAIDTAEFKRRYHFGFQADGGLRWAYETGTDWREEYYRPFLEDSTYDIMLQAQAVSTSPSGVTVIACRNLKVIFESWSPDLRYSWCIEPAGRARNTASGWYVVFTEKGSSTKKQTTMRFTS